MLCRLTEKLAHRLKVKGLKAVPLPANPLMDWSCHLFFRRQGDDLLPESPGNLFPESLLRSETHGLSVARFDDSYHLLGFCLTPNNSRIMLLGMWKQHAHPADGADRSGFPRQEWCYRLRSSEVDAFLAALIARKILQRVRTVMKVDVAMLPDALKCSTGADERRFDG
jgi:hypothetical protein